MQKSEKLLKASIKKLSNRKVDNNYTLIMLINLYKYMIGKNII